MAQQHPSGFTPDPEPDYSGFTPDKPETKPAETKPTKSTLSQNLGALSRPYALAKYGLKKVGEKIAGQFEPSTAIPQLAGKEPGILNPNLEENPLLLKSILPETTEEPGLIGKLRHGLYEGLVRPTASPLGAYTFFLGEKPAEHPNLGESIGLEVGGKKLLPPPTRRFEAGPAGIRDLSNPISTEVTESLPVRTPEVASKPFVRANLDKTFTNKETGQVFDKTGKVVNKTETGVVPNTSDFKSMVTRYYDLVDKDVAGTLTREELQEAKKLREILDSTGWKPPEVSSPTKAPGPEFEPVEKPTFSEIGNVPSGADFLSNVAKDSQALPEARAKATELLNKVKTGEISPEQAEQAFFTDVDARVARSKFGTVKPQAEFDPSTLKGLETTPKQEVQFADPNTGEIKPASEAKPGDVLIAPEETTPPIVKPPIRRARNWRPNLGPSEGPSNTEMFAKSEEIASLRPKAKPEPQIPPGGHEFHVPAAEGQTASEIQPSMPVRPPTALRGTANDEIRGYATYLKGEPRVSTGPINPSNVKPGAKVTSDLNKKLRTASGNAPSGPPPPKKPLVTDEQLNPDLPVIGRKLKPAKEQSMFSQIWNIPRALQSIDLPGVTSAALRQSRPLAFSRDWFKAWNAAYKSFGSKQALDAINDEIKSSKYFKPQYRQVINKAGDVTKYVEAPSIAERLGVKMTDVINNREEAIVSSLAERIPGYGRYVKASNRAYTGFLNQLRASKFEQLMDGAKAAGRDPETDQVLGKAIADFVNNATGRGSLKYAGGKINLEPIAEVLGDTLYSPRALSARLAFMNPYNYTAADPLIRRQYWQSLARIGASWGAFSGLASLAPGVHVSMDPNNADFGKIRIGNTRIDPGAGFQQLLVLAHREFPRVLGGGGTVASTGPAGQPGKFTPFGSSAMAPTRLSLPSRYIYNQLNPSLRFITDMLSATRKEPLDLTDRTLQLALPMYASDIADAAKDDNAVAEFFAPLLSSLGTGVQTYERGSLNKPQITPLIKKTTGVDLPTMKIGR